MDGLTSGLCPGDLRCAESLRLEYIAAGLVQPKSERERAIDVLRAAGLLAEPSAEMKARAAQATATLEEVSAALSRAGGQPLSEFLIEQRGPYDQLPARL